MSNFSPMDIVLFDFDKDWGLGSISWFDSARYGFILAFNFLHPWTPLFFIGFRQFLISRTSAFSFFIGTMIANVTIVVIISFFDNWVYLWEYFELPLHIYAFMLLARYISAMRDTGPITGIVAVNPYIERKFKQLQGRSVGEALYQSFFNTGFMKFFFEQIERFMNLRIVRKFQKWQEKTFIFFQQTGIWKALQNERTWTLFFPLSWWKSLRRPKTEQKIVEKNLPPINFSFRWYDILWFRFTSIPYLQWVPDNTITRWLQTENIWYFFFGFMLSFGLPFNDVSYSDILFSIQGASFPQLLIILFFYITGTIVGTFLCLGIATRLIPDKIYKNPPVYAKFLDSGLSLFVIVSYIIPMLAAFPFRELSLVPGLTWNITGESIKSVVGKDIAKNKILNFIFPKVILNDGSVSDENLSWNEQFDEKDMLTSWKEFTIYDDEYETPWYGGDQVWYQDRAKFMYFEPRSSPNFFIQNYAKRWYSFKNKLFLSNQFFQENWFTRIPHFQHEISLDVFMDKFYGQLPYINFQLLFNPTTNNYAFWTGKSANFSNGGCYVEKPELQKAGDKFSYFSDCKKNERDKFLLKRNDTNTVQDQLQIEKRLNQIDQKTPFNYVGQQKRLYVVRPVLKEINEIENTTLRTKFKEQIKKKPGHYNKDDLNPNSTKLQSYLFQYQQGLTKPDPSLFRYQLDEADTFAPTPEQLKQVIELTDPIQRSSYGKKLKWFSLAAKKRFKRYWKPSTTSKKKIDKSIITPPSETQKKLFPFYLSSFDTSSENKNASRNLAFANLSYARQYTFVDMEIEGTGGRFLPKKVEKEETEEEKELSKQEKKIRENKKKKKKTYKEFKAEEKEQWEEIDDENNEEFAKIDKTKLNVTVGLRDKMLKEFKLLADRLEGIQKKTSTKEEKKEKKRKEREEEFAKSIKEQQKLLADPNGPIEPHNYAHHVGTWNGVFGFPGYSFARPMFLSDEKAIEERKYMTMYTKLLEADAFLRQQAKFIEKRIEPIPIYTNPQQRLKNKFERQLIKLKPRLSRRLKILQQLEILLEKEKTIKKDSQFNKNKKESFQKKIK